MRPSSPNPVDLTARPTTQWSAAQAAALAAAEAIAATAAAEVVAEAAATARTAADVASAAAERAAAKASDVAAQAVVATAVATAAAAVGTTTGVALSAGDTVDAITGAAASHEAMVNATAAAAASAAAKVALCVAAVAAAAATAAVQAASMIGAQLERDTAATALAGGAITGGAINVETAPGAAMSPPTGVGARPPLPIVDAGELALAEELRVGVAAHQLRLLYQPIIDLSTGQAASVEALVRWQHPERGLLGPEEFIDVAERTGLVLPLGAWVLEEACHLAASLQRSRDTLLTVSVNLSGRQLSDRGLVGTVRGALARHGCRADRLVFEVTETALVTDMGTAIESLRELQELGAGVAIDDFGTGYSSLLYLRYLSANDLKIDRSFISGLGRDSYDTAIVASLITLAHNLNVRCVAEGVETVAQHELLRQLGCDFAQGYLFGRPVPAEALTTWLGEQATPATPSLAPATRLSPEKARIVAMHENGASSHTIAAALNADGRRTSRGLRWSTKSVALTLARRNPNG